MTAVHERPAQRVKRLNLHRTPSPTSDLKLERLSDAELQALMLLAEGHTVKSIAAQTGHSVGAINERLRHARRKTGASSSRELARLVKAQKVGDEKIGMVPGAPVDDASLVSRANNTRRWKIGGTVMSAILFGGIAAMLALGDPSAQQGQDAALSGRSFAPAPQSDQLLGPVVDPKVMGTDPATLHAKLRSEGRDGAWAAATEAALKDRYARLPHVNSQVRVICGSTLCEVAGILNVAESTTDAEWKQITEAFQKLLVEDAKALGLESSTNGFSSTSDKKPSFFAYLRRTS